MPKNNNEILKTVVDEIHKMSDRFTFNLKETDTEATIIKNFQDVANTAANNWNRNNPHKTVSILFMRDEEVKENGQVVHGKLLVTGPGADLFSQAMKEVNHHEDA